MPLRPALFIVFLILAGLSGAACRDARHYLEEKAAAKPKSSAASDSSGNRETPAALPSPTTKAAPAAFKGDIAGKAGKEKFYRFLEHNNQKTVRLDLLLSDEQLEQLSELDKDRKWYFDLAYDDQEGYRTGGEFWIDISKGKSGLRLEGNHLQGQVKITNWAGPHQGLMSIQAKPVAAESTSPSPEVHTAMQRSSKK